MHEIGLVADKRSGSPDCRDPDRSSPRAFGPDVDALGFALGSRTAGILRPDLEMSDIVFERCVPAT